MTHDHEVHVVVIGIFKPAARRSFYDHVNVLIYERGDPGYIHGLDTLLTLPKRYPNQDKDYDCAQASAAKFFRAVAGNKSSK